MRKIELMLALGAINFMTAATTGGRGRRGNGPDSDGDNTNVKGDGVADETDTIINPNREDSTLQVTDRARHALVDVLTEHVIETKVEEVGIEADVVQAFSEALGTTNILRGKVFPALRSNVYSSPNGKGQRAAALTQDGNVHMLAAGLKYGQAYEKVKQLRGMFAIIYFDQSDNSTNPHVRVSFYSLKDMPEPAGEAGGRELF